jgi:serine 3-dehydrogenase
MLKDKIVLITGASSGIGEACADTFARAKARLILVARRRDRLDEIAKRLRVESLKIQCDVRNRQEVGDVMSTLPDEWKNIDILINNAGLARGLSKLQDGDIEDWEEMIDTNIKGLLYVTRAVLPGMISRNSGTVVNIASIAGRQMYPNGNVYCATKSAVRAISESLQLDVNGTDVRVTNIDPGMVETEFSLVRFHQNRERASKTYQGVTPLSPKDVAEVVLFCVTRPPHVSIHDLLLMPTDQASTQIINKRVV